MAEDTVHILSETDCGKDYLGKSIYADAIAQCIHNARSSITIGIYAKWGSGKSFLLRHIQSVLGEYERRTKEERKEETCEDAKGKCDDTKEKSEDSEEKREDAEVKSKDTEGKRKDRVPCRILWWVSALVIVFALFGGSLLMVNNPSIFLPTPFLTSTESNQLSNTTTASNTTALSPEVQRASKEHTIKIVGYVFIALELIAILSVGLYSLRRSTSPSFGSLKILMYTAFTKIPMPTDESEVIEDSKQSSSGWRYDCARRYIFVNFKAWEYAGSDTLWAAIITNISDQIEKEFGVITSRLFRTLTVSQVSEKSVKDNSVEECCFCTRFCSHFVRHPVILCKFPRLLWWIILCVAFILIPVSVYLIADFLQLEIVQTYRPVPIYAQVLLWLPAPIAVAVIAMKFVWALCHSQSQRINKALDGTHGKLASQLGFMNVVKKEVQVMTNLIRIANFAYQKDYRVVISIDDLDQIDLKKVHAILNAVRILLSDKTSPFFCIIAADPRIVVKCIEDSLGGTSGNMKISGREYLKKIVNLPVCLPDIDESSKEEYITGLKNECEDLKTNDSNPGNTGGGNTPADDVDNESSANESSENKEISHEEFLSKCRCFLHDKELRRHIHGNARSMKRIFNIISLTACVLNCIVKKKSTERQKQDGNKTNEIVRTEKLAEQIVHWIVLAEEWPYRTSFIIQVIEDSDQTVMKKNNGKKEKKIPEEWTILEIYANKVQDHFTSETCDKTLLSLDGDPDLFQTYLELMEKKGFTKANIMLFLQHTINLDCSIRRKIALTLKPTRMTCTSGSGSTGSPEPPQ